MIIVGDIASPSEIYSDKLTDFFEENKIIFKNQIVVCNFEGLIDENNLLKEKTPVLFNHPSILKALNRGNVKIAALANNHVLDLPNQFIDTVSLLKKNNIATVGVGNTEENSYKPILVHENGIEVFLINACWNFLLYHQKNPTNNVHINTIDEFVILRQVKEIRQNHPEAKIAIYFHWSFDLEILPFPMYRQFSHDLIDAGASLIVGAHSHCIQGGEMYKKGCIIYGLGNFFIPNAVFANGKLKFPNWASEQLAIEWNIRNDSFILHWFDTQGDGENFEIKYIESSEFSKCLRIFQYSPFKALSFKEYSNYFKRKRRKKKLIPIFIDYKRVSKNNMKLRLLKFRAKLARVFAKLGLIKWQS